MDPKHDPLPSGMRIERLRREDGRALLLYSWPDRTELVDRPSAPDAPPTNPRPPDPSAADV